MSTILDNKKSFTLSPDDRARLERFAPLFGIDFVRTPDDSYRIECRVEEGGFVVTLSTEVAHRRLLAEICARASRWIHFHFGESCRDSLLDLSDAKVRRVAELYALSQHTVGRVAAV
jgi:hypothetical protein